jgi:hypothetical protein
MGKRALLRRCRHAQREKVRYAVAMGSTWREVSFAWPEHNARIHRPFLKSRAGDASSRKRSRFDTPQPRRRKIYGPHPDLTSAGCSPMMAGLVLTSGSSRAACERPSHGASAMKMANSYRGSTDPTIFSVRFRTWCSATAPDTTAAVGNCSLRPAFNSATLQRITMFSTPSGMPDRRNEAISGASYPAISERSSWVGGAPDILLIVLASLSLWALIVWAIIRYF